jgi:hypothetical protein
MTKTKPELRQQKLIISPEVKKGAECRIDQFNVTPVVSGGVKEI